MFACQLSHCYCLLGHLNRVLIYKSKSVLCSVTRDFSGVGVKYKKMHINTQCVLLSSPLLCCRWAWARGLKSPAHRIWLMEQQATPESSHQTQPLFLMWSCLSWSDAWGKRQRQKANGAAFTITHNRETIPDWRLSQPPALMFLCFHSLRLFLQLGI